MNNQLINLTTFGLWRKLQYIDADPDLLYINNNIDKFKKTNHHMFLNFCKKYNIQLNSNHHLINPTIRVNQPDFYFPHSSLIKKALHKSDEQNVNALSLLENNFSNVIAPRDINTANIPEWDRSKHRRFRENIRSFDTVIKQSIKDKIINITANNNNNNNINTNNNNVNIYIHGFNKSATIRPDTHTDVNGYEILDSLDKITTVEAKACFQLIYNRDNIITRRVIGTQTEINAYMQAIDTSLQLHPNSNLTLSLNCTESIAHINLIKQNPFKIHQHFGKGYFPALQSIIRQINTRTQNNIQTYFDLIDMSNVINKSRERTYNNAAKAFIITNNQQPNYYKHNPLSLTLSTNNNQITNVKFYIKSIQNNERLRNWAELRQGSLIRFNFDRVNTFKITNTTPKKHQYMQQRLLIDCGPWRRTLHMVNHPDINSPNCIHCNQNVSDNAEHLLMNCNATTEHRINIFNLWIHSIQQIIPPATNIRFNIDTTNNTFNFIYPNIDDNVSVKFHPLLTMFGTIPINLIDFLKRLQIDLKTIDDTTESIIKQTMRMNHEIIISRIKKSVALANPNNNNNININEQNNNNNNLITYPNAIIRYM